MEKHGQQVTLRSRNFASRVAEAGTVLALRDREERLLLIKSISESGDAFFGNLVKKITNHRAKRVQK